ncbi:MAG: diaminopimelate decarboxylase [Deltaproteobacteria bacterium]|jgi:diaminopimelate decarboxylase|nr:diaminopimelate decarboxylase [Deltaproteobacteria bacterium]
MNKIFNFDANKLVEKYGTPLYVYNKETIIDNYQKLKSSFQKYYPKTDVHYAVKANTNLAILKILEEEGASVDCSSPFELLTSEKAGFTSEKIMYTGNYESISDLEAAVKSKATINLDDISSLKRLLSFHLPERISFRINPGIGRGGFEGIVTGGTDAKFGVPYEDASKAYKLAQINGIKRFGIHMMTGSNNLEPYYFAEIVDKLLTIAGKVFEQLGTQPEYVDIGGGFGIPYHDEEIPLNLELTAQLVSEEFREKCKKYNLGSPRLKIEPGRYIAANAGYLLSKVTGTKSSYKKFVGIDSGMNTLLRPALYGASHQHFILGKDTATEPVNLCGRICENSDIFAKHIYLPEAELGDIVITKDAGAYGYAMASNYNGRLRPAEVLIDQGRDKLIRKRETLKNLFNLYPEDL